MCLFDRFEQLIGKDDRLFMTRKDVAHVYEFSGGQAAFADSFRQLEVLIFAGLRIVKRFQ